MSEQIGSAPWMEQWLKAQREAWSGMFSGMAGLQMPANKASLNPLLALGTEVPSWAQDSARKRPQMRESFVGRTRSVWESVEQREARGASIYGLGGSVD